MANKVSTPLSPWRQQLHEIIFEADTPAGKLFDVVLLWAILLNIVVVMLESVREFEQNYGYWMTIIEWVFTVFFTIEYILRIICVKRPIHYITSFYGVVDLLSIIPTYLGLFLTGAHSLVAIRVLRLLRVFRILKLTSFLKEASVINAALKASRTKITVFLVAVLSIIVVTGTTMYLIEGEENGFTSIPRSIYWAVVTVTTVGYGDIAPQTVLGQFISSFIMIIGYAIIAVPTGIVTAELNQAYNKTTNNACESCGREGHDEDADYCKYCGDEL